MNLNSKKIEACKASILKTPKHTFPYFLPIEPYGYRSAETEALSSYICRQADQLLELPHPFIQRLAHEEYRVTGIPVNKSMPSLGFYATNGARITAARYADAVNSANEGRFDANLLTLKPMAGLTDFNSRGLQRHYLAWCPECWREDLAVGRAPYLRLYWAMHLAKICCIHNCKLSEYCPCCGDVNHQFPKFPRQWICDKCGEELFNQNSEFITESNQSEDFWASHAIYQLIDRVYKHNLTINAKTVSLSIKRVLRSHSLSLNQFAEKLNINPRPLNDLVNETKRPFFPAFMDMCYRMDIPPDQFLFDKDILSSPDLWRSLDKPAFVMMMKLSDKNKKRILRGLSKEIENDPNPPVKVSEISKKHGVSYSSLAYNFPLEYQILRERYLDWEVKYRRSNHTDRLSNLCESVFRLVRHGIYPSDRKLRDLGYVKPSDLRRPEVKTLLRTMQQIYVDLGYFDG